MATEQPDIQQELDILLGAMARELGCSPSEVPFELEVVAKSALLAAYNKGFRRHRRLSESSLPAVQEEAPTAPAPRSARAPNAGVYLYVDRAKKGPDE